MHEYMRLQTLIANQRAPYAVGPHDPTLLTRLKAQNEFVLNDLNSLIKEVVNFQKIVKQGRGQNWMIGTTG
jgi:hypothetical protein